MKKYLWPIALILILYVSTSAMGDISVDVSVESERVAAGRRFGYTVTVEGALDVDVPTVKLPPQLVMVNYSSQTLTQIINGVSSVSRIFEFVLQATSEGKFKIGPVTVKHGGKEYFAGAIQIEVVAAGSPGAGQPKTMPEFMDQNLKVTLTTDKEVYYLGEPIIATGEIDSKLNLRNLNLSYDLQVRPDVFIRKQVEQKKGLQVQELYYAIKPGTYRIGPLTLHGSVSVPRSRRQSPFDFDRDFSGGFDNFFGSRERFSVNSNTIQITVKPLPEKGRPADFSNLVGEFEFDAKMQQVKVRVGEGLEIEITIAGNGNMEPLKPPAFEENENFDFYPPEEVFSSPPSAISGKKIYRLKTVPKATEITQLPKLSFSYFSPKAGQYIMIECGPFPIEVLAAGVDFGPIEGSKRPVLAGLGQPKRDIFGARNFAASVQTPASAYINRPLFMGLQALPLGLLALAILYLRHQRRLVEDTAFSRATRALRHAKKGLSQCQLLIERDHEAGMFYERLHRTLARYIADKLNIPSAGMTTEAALEKVTATGTPTEIISDLKEVMGRCDIARFAATELDQAEIHRSLKSAEKLIYAIEKNGLK